jgi:hypothetical protein
VNAERPSANLIRILFTVALSSIRTGFPVWSSEYAYLTFYRAPRDDDQDVYFVMDDLGRLGKVWREADPDRTDRETVIRDMLEGQYSNPVCVVSFNTTEGWSRDASDDIADALRRRCELEHRGPPSSIEEFLERFDRRDRSQLRLRLA